MDKEKKINLIALIILIGFVGSVFFHYIKAMYLNMPYPHNTFLFGPDDKFNDFYWLLEWNKNINPYIRDIGSAQYPLLNLISYLFSLIPIHVSFALFTSFITCSFVYINAIYLRMDDRFSLYAMRVFIFSFLTYPFLFTVDRGNFEGLLCIFLLLFIYLYQRERYIISSIFLAIAIAMKAFPLVLIVLFISEKKYKEVMFTVFMTIVLTLFSLLMFKGGFIANSMFLLTGSNVSSNPGLSSFLGNNNYLQRGVTLFTFFKIVFNLLNIIKTIDMTIFLKIYSRVMMVLFIALAGYVVLVEKEFWKRAALLVFAMLLFPHISADYKLLHIFIPLLLFINSEKKSRWDLFYVLMFAILLIPKDYYLLPNIRSEAGADISIAVLLNPMVMLAMMSVIIVSGLKNTDRNEVKSNLIAHVDTIKRVFRLNPARGNI